MSIARVFAFVFLAVSLLPSNAPAQVSASWIPLTFAASRANAINTAGDIVGAVTSAAGPHAVLWRNGVTWQGGEMIDLDAACPECQSIAYDINDRGDIVGVRDGQAFLWRNGVITILQPYIGGFPSSARSINNRGVIGGESGGRPVVWRSENDPPQRLALLNTPDGPETILGGVVNAIDDDDDEHSIYVGQVGTDIDFRRRAFFAFGSVVHTLPSLNGCLESSANGVNNSGVIVGSHGAGEPSSTGCLETVPVRWKTHGLSHVVEELPTVGGYGEAFDINDAGDIVGISRSPIRPIATLWRDGERIELPVFFPSTDGVARGVNNKGTVAGFGFNPIGGAPDIATKWTTLDADDNSLPSIMLPSNFTVDATGSAGASVTFAASGQDAEDGSLEATCNPASGAAFPIGFTTVACDVVDSGGLTASGTFTVFVLGVNTAPSITLPSNITVDATGPNGASVTFAASGQDAEDGSLGATCNPASGGAFGIGTTTVTCGVTDSGGLQASGTFTVTVLGATAQTQALSAMAAGAGPGGSLASKLNAILELLRTPAGAAKACGPLQAFINEVSAQSGKKINASQAAAMIAAAQRIRAVTGCR